MVERQQREVPELQESKGRAGGSLRHPVHDGGRQPRDGDRSERHGRQRSSHRPAPRALTTQYSYRDRLGIDWAALLEAQRDQLAAAQDALTFARRVATLLAKAKDKHLWLAVGDQIVPTYVRPATPNVNAKMLPRLVPHWKQDSSVLASGRWDDGIGYLRIDSWDRAKTKELAPIFAILERLKDAPALIIDVRLNSGGDKRIARSVAGCFIDKPTVYAKHVLVDADQPGGFSEPRERVYYSPMSVAPIIGAESRCSPDREHQ